MVVLRFFFLGFGEVVCVYKVEVNLLDVSISGEEIRFFWFYVIRYKVWEYVI